MPRTQFDYRRIKSHRSYSVEEISHLIGAHKNTVRAWIRDGLEAIDNSRPILILGETLKAFLKGKRARGRTPCPPGTFYCFRCRAPRKPALGLVEARQINATTVNLTGLCECCETVMYRRAARDKIDKVMPKIDVQISEA